ncbi:60S ribosomal protein L27a-2 [Citrus sinensis]|uniref:60S ribosomal protein L27a-2 n=1 Tax=Citrus sinensis TaxID=2711 RepID=A0ACB8JK92_CITSI|nr:60S ribosomal protein L27a-2 [Citrus sinensis]
MTAAHAARAAAAQQVVPHAAVARSLSHSLSECTHGSSSLSLSHSFNRSHFLRLWSPSHPLEVKAKASKDNVPTIDVTKFGYFKVLGKGLLLENQLVVVKAKLVSKTTKKKIKKAGGSVVFTA